MSAENLPPWARMALGYDGDPKVAALARFGDDAGLCRDLHLAMIRYSRREKTDGLVPPHEHRRLAFPLPSEHADALADHLAEVELISKCNGDGIAGAMAGAMATAMAGGWVIVNYAKWQETAAEIEAYSLAQAERGRKGADKRWQRDGSQAADQPVLAGAIAGGTRSDSARNGDRMAEVEREIDPVRPVRNVGARAADDGDDLDGLIQALMFGKTGKSITRDEAAAIRVGILSGRSVDNPAAYIRGAIATKTEARRLMPHRDSTTGSARPAREIVAASRRPGGPSADPAHQAQIARKLLAEAQAPPDPLPGADHDGEHDDEHDRQPAETEPLDAEPADDDPPW